MKPASVNSLYKRVASLSGIFLNSLSCEVYPPEKLDSDLFVIPSSVHEVLVGKTDDFDLSHLSEMVYDINQSEVSIEERLSNQLYYYNSKYQYFNSEGWKKQFFS